MDSDRRECILVVDDVPESVEVMVRHLSAEGFSLLTATNAVEAVRILDVEDVDLVITDFKMPKVDGLDLVKHVRETCLTTEVMMVTGYASIEGAVDAMKLGAVEYLSKPFTSEELVSAVKRALERTRRRRLLESPPAAFGPLLGFVGDSAAMRHVYKLIDRAARTSATVTISGESGTGKELAARAVHYRSTRASLPFVAINCGGIPEGLLESELFGHVKGSFTGAAETRAGFFQTADGGTVFLDEVSEMAAAMQVKLLRVLQEREICMVGSTRPIRVDVRIIAATNKDLQGLVERQIFREDLYYRLNVIAIEMPPLRQRDDDVLKLTALFAEKYAKEAGRRPPRFSERAIELMMTYHWPGNVRELENTVQRLVLMTDKDVIDAPDLPSLLRMNHIRAGSVDRTLAQMEAEHIRSVLARVGGNKTRAARILGIDRKTRRAKLHSMNET